MSDEIIWPPIFTLTKKANAKHIKIKTSIVKGLEIITPIRFNLKNLPNILESHKEWILQRLQLVTEKKLSANSEEQERKHGTFAVFPVTLIMYLTVLQVRPCERCRNILGEIV